MSAVQGVSEGDTVGTVAGCVEVVVGIGGVDDGEAVGRGVVEGDGVVVAGDGSGDDEGSPQPAVASRTRISAGRQSRGSKTRMRRTRAGC